MRTIAIVNMKGGVGKTTTAVNLATTFVIDHGQRVLLVDCDGQGNTSRLLLPRAPYPGLANILTGRSESYWSAIHPTGLAGLDVLPTDGSLWRVDLACVARQATVQFDSLSRLVDEISAEDIYDTVIFDCPPSFSGACVAAITATTDVIIPVLPDAFSVTGMTDLVEQLDGLREVNPRISILGCVITQDHNAPVVVDAVEMLRADAPIPVFNTTIRRTDKVLESTFAGEAVLTWSPRSAASICYRKLGDEVLAKVGRM